MLNQPKLKPCYRTEMVDPEAVFFFSERESSWLNDRLARRLVPLLDGKHTIEEILEEIQTDFLLERSSFQKPEALFQDALNVCVEAQQVLMRMLQKGYLVENNAPLPSNLAIFCNHLNVDCSLAQYRLQTTKVTLEAFGCDIPMTEFKAALESLHIQVAEDGDLAVVLTDDYLQDGLDAFNQQALQLKRSWMLVKPVGTEVWIGPIFTPEVTGCWQCLAQRLHDNRPVDAFVQKSQDTTFPLIPPLSSLSSTCQTALGMAATEIFKWIVQGENKRLLGTLVTYDTLSLDIQNHRLVKRPQCPTCGEISKGFPKSPLPIVLGHQKKRFTNDGGHRCFSPEETLQRYQHHISPLTGVVRELRKIGQHSNHSIHTYIARHHFVTLSDDLDTLRHNVEGISAGKGRTDQQAKTSGFCEAIERYSGVFQGNEIRKISSYQQLGDNAIHPNACMNFSQAQYEGRSQWNATCSSLSQRVPEPFDEEKEIEWTPVWSLTAQEFKYLPTAFCYFGYPAAPKPDCWADSNGCAAGNTLEEAILQGFMELVERDCVALWWYNCIKRPKVDLDSFDDPYFQVLKEYYQGIHRELWVLDITSDLNIPAFAAITSRTDRNPEDIILGYGAHFDPKIALLRALTEANQILPNVLASNADGSTQYPLSADPVAMEWWKNTTLENQPYLIPDDEAPPKAYADYPQLWSDDLLDDVMRCQQIIENKGMEMLVLDQTRPDIGLRVVKVIVPGMRHWWKRLGSGRLYDVPAKLGSLKESLTENQLNPWPMWM
jgi:oxazoline/thiazoline synthase